METQIYNLTELRNKPVAMMTGDELFYLLENSRVDMISNDTLQLQPKRMFYGIEGIAQVFGCSVPTANRIKKSGIIDDAITQVGRKIVIDGDMVLALVKANGGVWQTKVVGGGGGLCIRHTQSYRVAAWVQTSQTRR